MTRQEKIEKAVKVLSAPKGSINQKCAFLQSKGLTGDEITEALNHASGGKVVKTALF